MAMNTAAFQEGEYCMYFKNQINSLHIQRKPMKGGGTGNWNHIPSASLSAGCWAKPQGGLECCRGAGDLTLEVPCKNIPAVPHSLLCCCPSLVPCCLKSLPHSKQFLHTKLAFFSCPLSIKTRGRLPWPAVQEMQHNSLKHAQQFVFF